MNEKEVYNMDKGAFIAAKLYSDQMKNIFFIEALDLFSNSYQISESSFLIGQLLEVKVVWDGHNRFIYLQLELSLVIDLAK